MEDQKLTRAKLEKELSALRRKVIELESSMVEREVAVQALQESEERYNAMAAGLEQMVEARTEELLEVNQTLRALIQASPLAIAVLDREGKLRSWNQASERMFGWTEAEALVQLNPIVSAEEDREEALAGRRRVLEGESIIGVELRRQRKDGSPIDVEFWGAPIRDAHGELSGGIFIYADVTQRKHAEEELRETNETLRALIEASPLAIGVLDRDRNLRTWNKAGERMFGWTEAEALAQPGPMLSPVEYRDQALERQGRLLAGESLLGLELRHRKKDGSPIDVEVWAAPLQDSHGEISGSVVIYADITQRKAAQEALRQAEEKYRSIFENSVEGIFQLTTEGELISGNPALVRILGFESPEGITTTQLEEQYTRPEQAYYHELGRLIREQGSVSGYEVQERRRDGSIIWVSISARAVYDQAGDLAYYEGTLQDITEHKLAEEALRESEERYRSLVETAQDIIYTLSIDGTITSLNPAFETITGWPRSEWVGKPVADLIHSDDLGPATDLVQRFSQGDRPSFERRVLTKSGEYLNCEFITTPQMRDGTLIGVVGIGRDITERKLAEEALRASEEEYRSLFNDSKDTIFVTARDGTITDVNQAALDLFGYIREEILGLNASKLCVSVDDHTRLVQEADQQGSVKDFEIRLINKDGTEMDCLVTASLRRDSEGRILAYQGVVRDITDRKRAEEELRQSEERFRNLVEYAADPIFVMGPGGSLVDVNRRACDVLGYAREELLTLTYTSVFPSLEQSAIDAMFQSLESGGDSITLDGFAQLKNGSTIDVEMH